MYNYTKLDSLIKEFTDRNIPHRRNIDTDSNIILVFIDLDRFKEINDEYGHNEGDEVLKRVAMRLRSLFRSDDMIFRTGGDEFIVILQLDKKMDTESIMNRIEDVLSSITITSVKKGYSVQLSYGIKSGPVTSIKELIHDADLKMYDNKKEKQDES